MNRKELWDSRPHVCGICGKPIECLDAMQVDHIIPKSRGGSDDESNLQLSHSSCNIKKSNKMTQASLEQRVHELELQVQSLLKEVASLKKKVKSSPNKSSDAEIYESLARIVSEQGYLTLSQATTELASYTKKQIEDAYRACHDDRVIRDDLTIHYTKVRIQHSRLEIVVYHRPDLHHTLHPTSGNIIYKIN